MRKVLLTAALALLALPALVQPDNPNRIGKVALGPQVQDRARPSWACSPNRKTTRNSRGSRRRRASNSKVAAGVIAAATVAGARDYWLRDYRAYDLPSQPYGAIWARVGSDALLVDQDSGEVITAEYDVFY